MFTCGGQSAPVFISILLLLLPHRELHLSGDIALHNVRLFYAPPLHPRIEVSRWRCRDVNSLPGSASCLPAVLRCRGGGERAAVTAAPAACRPARAALSVSPLAKRRSSTFCRGNAPFAPPVPTSARSRCFCRATLNLLAGASASTAAVSLFSALTAAAARRVVSSRRSVFA